MDSKNENQTTVEIKIINGKVLLKDKSTNKTIAEGIRQIEECLDWLENNP